ncbi:MAG: type I-B CRISPR-associated protein Cas5b [Clostridia bacterium]|nr:type I-B CRISPR-associated protein Cas5b [Clostridia bacterium]
MRRAIRIRAYQNLPNFRKPAAIAIQDSYKLPPYSTVIGMVHTACGYTKYHSMDVSIAGRYHTSISDMYTRYYFGISFDATRHQYFTARKENDNELIGGSADDFYRLGLTKEGKDGITRGLGYVELLVDLELLLYIFPEEEDFEEVLEGLKNPKIFPSLGRHEDLLRIDEVKEVELSSEEDIETNPILCYDTLIPQDYYEALEGNSSSTEYVLNKVFEVKDGYRRISERVRARCVKSDTELSYAPLMDIVDGELIGVFPA